VTILITKKTEIGEKPKSSYQLLFRMSQITEIVLAENGNLVSTFLGQKVRTVMKDDEPWFVVADICKLINKRRTDKMKVLQPYEKGSESIASLGGPQNMAICSESGMYKIILRCADAVKEGTIAFRFTEWITRDLLPTIRRTGRYDIREHPDHVVALQQIGELTLENRKMYDRCRDARSIETQLSNANYERGQLKREVRRLKNELHKDSGLHRYGF